MKQRCRIEAKHPLLSHLNIYKCLEKFLIRLRWSRRCCRVGKFLSLPNVMSPLHTVFPPAELSVCQLAFLPLSAILRRTDESCGCKAGDEGRWVPLLIRTVLAVINRC